MDLARSTHTCSVLVHGQAYVVLLGFWKLAWREVASLALTLLYREGTPGCNGIPTSNLEVFRDVAECPALQRIQFHSLRFSRYHVHFNDELHMVTPRVCFPSSVAGPHTYMSMRNQVYKPYFKVLHGVSH